MGVLYILIFFDTLYQRSSFHYMGVLYMSLLSDNPSLGHPGRLPSTHELVIPKTRYIVPYRVRPRLQQIEILRVFHASRNLPERW